MASVIATAAQTKIDHRDMPPCQIAAGQGKPVERSPEGQDSRLTIEPNTDRIIRYSADLTEDFSKHYSAVKFTNPTFWPLLVMFCNGKIMYFVVSLVPATAIAMAWWRRTGGHQVGDQAAHASFPGQ